MGLGKITRGLGKVGLAIEALRIVWIAGKALHGAVRGRRSKQAGEHLDAAPDDSDASHGAQDQENSGGHAVP